MKSVAALLLVLCVVVSGVRAADVDADVAVESQAELDAAHENTVATLEEYAEKAHALRDEIVSTEHSLMEQMATIDSCPASELSGLMARAKKQITHLFQIKALYLAIKQQEAQLRSLVDAGTGKRVPSVAPKSPAPVAPVARPTAAPVAPAAPAAKPSNYAEIATMNAKLHNALSRLEKVTARLAAVEHRQGSSKTATLVIAAQMESDEKRLNKHARVLRRVRASVKDIKKSLDRLAKSCARSKRAEAKISRRSAARKLTPLRRKAAAARRAGRKSAKPQSAAARRAAQQKVWASHKFDVKKCYARCRKVNIKFQSRCVRICDKRKKRAAAFAKKKAAKKAAAKKPKAIRKPARKAAAKRRAAPKRAAAKRVIRRARGGKRAPKRAVKRAGKRVAKRSAGRSKALDACLKTCKSQFRRGVSKAGSGKKCALKCFRRHSHRPRAKRSVARPSPKLRACTRSCAALRVRGGRAASRQAQSRCRRACAARYGAKKAKKAVRKGAFNLKGCLAKCPKSKKNAKRQSRRCTRTCYAKAHAARRAAKGKGKATNKALKNCFKTCRKGGKWDRKCVKSCRTRFGKKPINAKKANAKALKQCFKSCRAPSRTVTKGKRRVVVKGKWNMKCVKSCRQRFGAKKAKKAARRSSPQLRACYKTCRGASKTVIRGKGKKARRVVVKGKWNMKCVRSCRKRFGKKAKKAPNTAAYKACLKRCPTPKTAADKKRYAKCKKACAKHNRALKIKVVSPSSKKVRDAMRALKKAGKGKGKGKGRRPETWEDVVRDSRRLLKRTVKLRDLVHKQVGRYMDTKDVEGRKYNGWWSIWDVLKGVKPGSHYTGRAKQIASDVKQIMEPALAKAADGPYGEVVTVLKGADEAFSSKYTKELGSPALDLSVDPKFDGYVEKPLPGARIRHVPYNPKKPYALTAQQKKWKKTPPLSRLPELIDEKYDENLKPVYARDFKVRPRAAAGPAQPFALKTKNWDYPQIPYSYPVKMVTHNPKASNPHVRPPTPGFHAEWPEFRFQQTADSSAAAAAPMAAPAAAAESQGAPMTEGAVDA